MFVGTSAQTAIYNALVAVHRLARAVLGFASGYCIEGQRHGPSVYVRGRSARQAIGSALLATRETRLTTGRSVECVFIRKKRSAVNP